MLKYSYTANKQLTYQMLQLVTSSIEGDGSLCFRCRRYVGRYIYTYVCEQLPGSNSSLTITKIGHRGRGD